MRKVITYGTFDMFHEGHKNILKRAKDYGDYLIVAVTGEDYDIGRGKLSVRDSLSKRIENVKKSGFADEVIVEEYLGQKIFDIIKYGIDVFVIGDDWKGKFDIISEYCELVYLPRTEGISSTQIREETFSKYRIGIISDRCDDNMLIKEARKVSGYAVTSFFAKDEAIAKQFGTKFNVEDSLSEWDSFIDKVDIVFIRTALEERFGFTKKSLLAGKHVIIDNPCSLKKIEENEILNIANKNNRIVIHNQKVLHTKAFIQLLWIVKSGMIGDVIRIECSAAKNDSEIKQMFYDLTTSALAIVFNLMGTEYERTERRLLKDDNIIEYMSMTLKYPETDVIINIGNRIRMMNKIEIIGSKGSIWMGDNWWRADSFELMMIDGTKKTYAENYDGNGFKFLIKDLSRMIEDGRKEYRLMDREIVLAIADVLEDIG